MLMRIKGVGTEFLVETSTFAWARPALPSEPAAKVTVCFGGERFYTTYTLEQIERILRGLHPDAM